MTREEGLKIAKSRECIGCKHFFECKGKPKKIERCVNFEERKKNEQA